MKIKVMKTVGRDRLFNSVQIGAAISWEPKEICLHLHCLCWWVMVVVNRQLYPPFAELKQMAFGQCVRQEIEDDHED